ncbi:hypothetical protein [uncultured Planococcus sp.]|uniref:hypothetical protein n=1 Tax=uncultured Planococcus sp. TaxID=337815 RepID=UPI00261C1AF4|nr:hypothetical protein [uncultured Planococcus sp.]
MGFWSNAMKTKYRIEVTAGARFLEPRLDNVRMVNLVAGDERGDISFEVPMGWKKPARLIDIAWENETYTRSAGKTAAGAIVGGVVAGPVGGIIGGAMGAKRKNESKAALLCQDVDGSEFEVVIKCDAKLFRNIENLVAV